MSKNFKINFRMSKGNLLVSPKGDFDNFSAYELVHLLHDKYEGKRQIFIECRCEENCDTCKCSGKKTQ
jgi:hypothetical protein